MKTLFTCTIPVPLSINRTYAVAAIRGHARMYKTSAAKAYEDVVMVLVRSAYQNQSYRVHKSDRLRISLAIYPPSLRADTDGGLKLTKDAVAKGMNINDRQFWSDRIDRIAIDKNNPHCELTISLLT